ncbi:MAG: hypothetical protein QF632_04645 [Candidatus Woesearchaeota archaeon]|nr:hypothetical protein [Candidatus Woesearchaeota archaeon]MDP7324021.1 hypothetical protein [Candidatus Woesearchaeota archaeon]
MKCISPRLDILFQLVYTLGLLIRSDPGDEKMTKWKKIMALGMAAAMVATVPVAIADTSGSFCDQEEQLYDEMDAVYEEAEERFVELDEQYYELLDQLDSADDAEVEEIEKQLDALEEKYEELEEEIGVSAMEDEFYDQYYSEEDQAVWDKIDAIYEEHYEDYVELEEELYELYDAYDEAWEEDDEDELDRLDEEIIELEDKLFSLDDKFGITELEESLPEIYCGGDYEEDRIYEVEEEIDRVLGENKDVYEALDRRLDSKLDTLVEADPEDQEAIVQEIKAIEQEYQEVDEQTGLDKLFYELGRLWFSFFE